jgi:hypothetical protein
MSDFPNVITEVAWTTDPAATPTWVDESAYLKELHTDRGRDSELDDVQPGTATYVFNDTARRFDNTSGANAGNVLPMKRVRSRVPGPLQGLEFWGDFEHADEHEWDFSGQGQPLECRLASAQFTTVTSPVRLGARAGQFTVAPGDKFGTTTGERCETNKTSGWGAGSGAAMEGIRQCVQFSVRFKSPWTNPVGWGIFHQRHSNATYGQAPFKFRVNLSTGAMELRVNSGDFANTTDALAGSPCTFDATYTLYPGPLLVDTWYDFRYFILWTKYKTGRVVVQCKLSTDTAWTTPVDVAQVQTLPTVNGASVGSITERIGWYRDDSPGVTNVVFQDGYQSGHTFDEVSYSAPVLSATWDEITRGPATNICENPDWESGITGQTNAGGGVITRTQDATRSKFGTKSLKVVTDGAAGTQGVFFLKSDNVTRFSVTAGQTYTAAVWASGDGAELVRIGIEYFDGASVSLGLTNAFTRSLRTAWRRHVVTIVAPAGAVTARVRFGLGVTAAATFYVDGVGFWAGDMDGYLFDGYFESFPQTWPDRLIDAEVQATAVDGFKPLNLFLLANNGGLETGTTKTFVGQHGSTVTREVYLNSVSADQPYVYTRLGDVSGTEVENLGRSAITGTYKNTPLLGDTGLLIGSTATSVKFRAAQSESVGGFSGLGKFANDHDPSSFTLEWWWKPATVGAVQVITGGEGDGTFDTWRLQQTAAGKILFHVRGTAANFQLTGNTTMVAGTTYYLVAVYTQLSATSGTIDLDVNNVSDGTQVSVTTALHNAGGAGVNTLVQIGRAPNTASFADGNLQEGAIYDYVLPAARRTAHFMAGSQGFVQQLSGARAGAILDLVGAWASSTRWIQTGQRQVQPVTYAAQSALSELQRTAAAEWPGLYFHAGRNAPVFLDRDWRTRIPYTTSQATFGDDGSTELPYDDITLSNDDSFLINEVRETMAGADLPQIASDATSKTKYMTRVEDESDVLVINTTEAQAIADAKLARFKDPLARVTSVTFPVSGSDADLFHQTMVQEALYREIGDQITLKRRPKGGTAITQASFIERVKHDINFESRTWNTTYAVSPR